MVGSKVSLVMRSFWIYMFEVVYQYTQRLSRYIHFVILTWTSLTREQDDVLDEDMTRTAKE